MKTDLFIEMVEVYIHALLYVRGVYPEAIFRRRRIYSTTSYFTIYPPLKEYIVNALKTALELKRQDKLFQVEMVIYQREFELFGTPTDEEVLERYVFRVECDENDGKKEKDLELYILRFEEELRRGLMQLEQSTKHLNPLDQRYCNFRIQLETTETEYVKVVTKENAKTEVSQSL